jgi:hypothetical protein
MNNNDPELLNSVLSDKLVQVQEPLIIQAIGLHIKGTQRPRGGQEVLLYSFCNLCVRWGLVDNATPWLLYPRERPSIDCMRLGGPQGWSGQVWKISPPLGFDPWIVQPVASRYTDRTIPATRFKHSLSIRCTNKSLFFFLICNTYVLQLLT